MGNLPYHLRAMKHPYKHIWTAVLKLIIPVVLTVEGYSMNSMASVCQSVHLLIKTKYVLSILQGVGKT